MRRLIVPAVLIVTGALGALAFAAPAIEAGGGGHGGCAGPPRDGAGQHVTIANNCYSPAVLYAQPGESVTWVNQDDYGHNVVTFDGELLGDQKQFFQGGHSGLMKGDKLTYTFYEPGLYAYYCSIHPSMLGVVAVGDPASPEFGAALTVQAPQQRLQTVAQHQPDATHATVSGLPGKMDGQQAGGVRWAEAALGLGLFGGLLVGLVAVGGGLRSRRPR